jgi:hypothetical protein
MQSSNYHNITYYSFVKEFRGDQTLISLFEDKELKKPLDERLFETDFIKSCGAELGSKIRFDFRIRSNNNSGLIEIILTPNSSEESVINPPNEAKLTYKKRETNYGVVVEIEEDGLTNVYIYPDNEMSRLIEGRHFETDFLEKCGVIESGAVKLDYEILADGKSGVSRIIFTPYERVLPDIKITPELIEQVRKKFPPIKN